MLSFPEDRKNLFVYGSLREPSIFESVCGLTFTLKPSQTRDAHTLYAELAMLDGYRRVSPDNVYFYAVPDPTAKIQGFVIHDVPAAALAVIDKYEGKLYARETVRLHTANGTIEALAYLGELKTMKKRFGDRFHVNLIHELWLRKRIERFFERHTRPGETSMDAEVERKARSKLLGTKERDLVVSHLGNQAVSDYFLEHELNRPIPSIRPLYEQPQARPFMENYLSLVVRQVLLNQFEWNIMSRFRFELDRLNPTKRYYTRILSLLISMRMLNANRRNVELILKRCFETLPIDGTEDLIDYVKFAVSAADSVFDARVVRGDLQILRNNLQPGLVPMGAEMEFSNLGFRAVWKEASNQDPVFDGFCYFTDFGLDILTWKMGGYVDDNSGTFAPRRQGYFEVAPGRLNIAGELSKPATGDPWVLGQLIRETIAFYPVAPHSLHLSFQLRRNQLGRQSVMPLSFVKCLLALGGGTQVLQNGRLWISRMGHREISQDHGAEELVFSRTSKRKSRLPADALEYNPPQKPFFINQYKFIRLDARANYEPLIMALKGIQLAINPGDYLTAQQLAASRKLRDEYEELKAWAYNPAPISRQTRERFLDTIHEGLLQEAHRRPWHKLHYIEWALGAINLQIRLFNKQVEEAASAAAPTRPDLPHSQDEFKGG